jgi:hypothetical protein
MRVKEAERNFSGQNCVTIDQPSTETEVLIERIRRETPPFYLHEMLRFGNVSPYSPNFVVLPDRGASFEITD